MSKILCSTCKYSEKPATKIQYYEFYCNCLKRALDGKKNCRYYQHKDPIEWRKIQLKTLCFTCKNARLPNHDMQKFECDFPYECYHNGRKKCNGYIKTDNGEINELVVSRLSWGGY